MRLVVEGSMNPNGGEKFQEARLVSFLGRDSVRFENHVKSFCDVFQNIFRVLKNSEVSRFQRVRP
jgi:hypothetical protein